MNNLKKIEYLLLNIIKENELEVGVGSSEMQELIESNIDMHFKTEDEVGTNFFITNDDFKIFSNETLLLVNIFNPKKKYLQFEDYIEYANNQVQNEIDLFIKSLDDDESVENVNNNDEKPKEVDIYIYLIVSNFEEVIRVQNYSKRFIPKRNKKFKFSLKLFARTVSLDYEIKSEIEIDSRLESVKLIDSNQELEGYIFTAKLHDVTKLYKEIGPDLFISNLRIGIKDQNNVDDSIKETILNDHKNFWYYNNGITLIIKEENIDFGNPDRLILTYKNSKDFTVVNGAQTITSASNVFFNQNEAFNKNRVNIENQTKVLLRVIKIPSISHTANDIVSKIAISLNRQKPITQEDIAYVVKFIDVINFIHSEKHSDYSFRIVRRGEGEYLGTNEYELLTVARILKAYLASAPGPARNSGNKILLKTETKGNNIYFSQEDIFLEKDTYNDESKYSEYEENVFNKYYKPVNFGVRLKFQFEDMISSNINLKLLPALPDLTDIYDDESFEKLKIDLFNFDGDFLDSVNDVIIRMIVIPTNEEVFKSISYGKYHLITFIINFLMNHKTLEIKSDFSSWKDPNWKNLNGKDRIILYNHAQVFSLAWKIAFLKSNTTNLPKKNYFDLGIFIAKCFDSNFFKNSKIPNSNNTQGNHLSITYKFYLEIIEKYKKNGKYKFK